MMLVCRRLPNLCQVLENCVHTRPLTTATMRNSVESSSHRKHRTQRKSQDKSNRYKKELKFLQKKILLKTQETSNDHIYKRMYPWEGSLDLAIHLKQNEIFNEDGLIVLNKPYGIAQNKLEGISLSKAQTLLRTVNSGNMPAHLPVMSQVLPHLKKLYDVKELNIIKSCERWSSGLMLLSTSQKVTDKVGVCLKRSKAVNEPPMTYKVITLGKPIPETINKKVAISLEHVSNIGSLPVILTKYSQRSVSFQKVKPVTVEHKLIMYNDDTDTSLLEIKTQVPKWHFLRVWSAFCYSPILGDHLYSGRVKKLCGKRILVSLHNAIQEAQDLPDNLYLVLGLPPESSELIPLHLHLSQITLKMCKGSNSNLTLTAPPPPHFTWTCDQLKLSPDEEEPEEDVLYENILEGT